MNTEPYPWHRQAWFTMEHALRNDRLPHALLLHASPGSGMGCFVSLLKERVLAADADRHLSALQTRLVRAGTHPDLYQLQPEKEGGVIAVDGVRELIDFMQLSSHNGSRRVACIRPAEAMTRSACNCLLKILEEPPGPALLLLLAHRPYMLPPTVRSRTVRIDLNAKDQNTVQSWLKVQGRDVEAARSVALQGIGPLALIDADEEQGRALDENILQDLCPAGALPAVPAVTERWQVLGTGRVLQWLAAGTRMLTRDHLRASSTSEAPPRLRKATSGLKLLALVRFYDRINVNLRLMSVAGTSERALLEDSLLAWRALTEVHDTEDHHHTLSDMHWVEPDVG